MGEYLLKLEIARDAAADALLADAGFCAAWDALAEQCPWATPLQSPGFARCWYSVYRGRFAPLLVISRDSTGALQGLLPLAVSVDTRQFVHVGAHQAEYQCWLALPAASGQFIWQAIQLLRREAPRSSLCFRYLPPGTPVDWLDDPTAQRTCLLRTYPRPRMLLDGKEIDESLKKRGNKCRLRKLRRLGEIAFSRVEDPAKFESKLDQFALFYDARRLAMNGLSPFASDPLKRPFHVEMMKVPGLAHASVLTCGDRVTSFHFNLCGRRHLQLNLFAHDPILGACSPGKLHILYLAQALIAQGGFDWIDLTPGGEAYKERFANAWDEAHTLTVFRSPLEKRAAAVRESMQDRAKTAIVRWNVQPSQVKAKLLKYTRMGPVALVKSALGLLSPAREAYIYWRNIAEGTAAATLAAPNQIRRDAIDDLMKYVPDDDGPTRPEFLSEAFRRIEDGQRVYTYAEDGRLLHCAWFAPEPEKELAGETLPGFELPPHSGLIVDCYTFPGARRRGLGAASLAAILSDASREKDLNRAYIAVPSESTCARRLVERAGFTYERSCLRRFLTA